MKRITGALFLLWTGVIVVAYYVVQKPGLLNAFTGLADTLWTLVVAAILLFNAYGLGRRALRRLGFDSQDSIDHLLLGWGIGLGLLGLLGLLFSAIQLANASILIVFQIALSVFFLLRHDLETFRTELDSLLSSLRLSFSQYGLFTKLAILLPVTFSFLLTLVPPFEAFDALLYHLTLPANVVQNGGLYPANNVAFWFPSLTENVYLWALGMGSERAAQIIHFAWALLSAVLLWHWCSKIWGPEIGRKVFLLLSAIPSLPILASWAYADMALVYYAVATTYTFGQYGHAKSWSWLYIAGLMAGFAMGIKYTSFVVPLTCGLLLILSRPFHRAVLSTSQFSSIALITALPWYVRNAIFMGNPFYPFLFGGRYWNDFLMKWYADLGTGIGWDTLRITLLPLNTALGTHDVTFFDGRSGPLFLILAPFTIWILLSRARQDSAEGWSLFTIGIFSLLSFAAWTVGVINSAALWQARLLLPALIPFAIPTALAWDSLKQFDRAKLRISYIVNALIGIVIVLTVFDNGVFVLQRNPLAVALGAQSRENYIERVNPSYAELIHVMATLPANARVYSLFEPRTYSLPRQVQPDVIISNFAHDLYLYETSAAVIEHWKSEQYTHILVYERGLDFMAEYDADRFTPAIQGILQETLGKLRAVTQTTDQVYTIYEIP